MAMKTPNWVQSYIGIPYEMMDCYSLVCSVYSGQLGVILPNVVVPDTDVARRDEIVRNRSDRWQQVNFGEEEAFDVLEIALPVIENRRWRFLPIHLGLVVSRGLLLHTLKPIGSHVRPYGPTKMMPERAWRWCG